MLAFPHQASQARPCSVCSCHSPRHLCSFYAGHDDALAIILAGHHSGLKLLGLSTVAGNQTVEKVTANALGVLSAAGLSSIGVAIAGTPPGTVPSVSVMHVYPMDRSAMLRRCRSGAGGAPHAAAAGVPGHTWRDGARFWRWRKHAGSCHWQRGAWQGRQCDVRAHRGTSHQQVLIFLPPMHVVLPAYRPVKPWPYFILLQPRMQMGRPVYSRIAFCHHCCWQSQQSALPSPVISATAAVAAAA